MSNLTINERFTLDADPEVVWGYLIDPERIVRCLPGAEFLGQEGENTYAGAVKVKVGAVSVSYKGKAVFEEIDHEARRVRIVGRGREKSGSGTATMTMESQVVATESGGAEVTVEAQLKLAGKIVRFGRGMIETISAEIFREFTERLADVIARDLEAKAAPAATAAPEGGEGGGAGAASTGESHTDPEGPGDPVASTHAAGMNDPSHVPEDPGGTRSDDDNSIALLPLLMRVIKRKLRRLFGRD